MTDEPRDGDESPQGADPPPPPPAPGYLPPLPPGPAPPPGQPPPAWQNAPPPASYGAQPPQVVVVSQSTSGHAIASLVLGLVWVVGITSVLAIVFGVMAKRRIEESNGMIGGGGMATAGIVLGIIGIVAAVVYIIWIAVILSDPSYRNDIYY